VDVRHDAEAFVVSPAKMLGLGLAVGVDPMRRRNGGQESVSKPAPSCLTEHRFGEFQKIWMVQPY
jgi:hypothetical protein